jgi:hypothetical protein
MKTKLSKIISILIIAALIMSLLVSCGKKEASEIQDNDNLGILDISDLLEMLEALEEADETYSTFSDLFEYGGIRIAYPQVEGMNNTEKQEEINELIFFLALGISLYYEEDVHDILTLPVEYEITRSDSRILSIKFTGTSHIEGEEHTNNLLYTANIDIRKGERITLEDAVELSEEFVRLFMSDTTQTLTPDSSDTSRSAMSEESMMRRLSFADSFAVFSGDFSYYTEDGVVISFGAPLSVGGFTEYKLSYEDLEIFINSVLMQRSS